MKNSRFLSVSLSAVCLSSCLYGGGFEGSGIGPRALSMGGAFVGLADDWSAAFWNPAGLAFLREGWGGGVSLDLLDLHAMDGNSIANPTPPITPSNIAQGDPFLQLGGEPSHFNITDTTIQAALPSGVLYKSWRGWTASAGVFSPLGFSFDIDDKTIPGLQASFKNQGYILNYNLSIAHEWQNRWAIGLGVNWLDARLKRDATKESSSYLFNSSSDGRGQGVQAVFGFLGKLHPKVSVGGSYKTGSDLTLRGATTVNSGLPVIPNEASGQTSALRNPAVYMIGLAFFPTQTLTVTTDWNGTDWRPMRINSQYDHPGFILQNQDFNAGWRFTNRFRIGTEYRWQFQRQHALLIRGGYTRDPWAVPDSGVSVTNLVDVNRNVYTFGLSWPLANFQPEIGFAYATGSRTIGGVEYKRIDQLLSIGLQYRTL